MIQQLDIPRAQVHIGAIIAEVSLDRSQELGVQWVVGDQDNGAFSSQFSGAGTTIPGLIAGATGLSDGALFGLGSISDSAQYCDPDNCDRRRFGNQPAVDALAGDSG